MIGGGAVVSLWKRCVSFVCTALDLVVLCLFRSIKVDLSVCKGPKKQTEDGRR